MGVKISIDRLRKSMDRVNEIALTEAGGVNRLALSDADRDARDLLKKWMEEEEMEVRVDDVGNMYGRLQGTEPGALPVCVGSHLDTQPNGGKYDGVLGVLSGLEVIRTLKENNVQPRCAIELINWTNEEGARFEPALIGSGVAAGFFEADWAYNLVDKDGKLFKDELKRIGYLGEKSNRLTEAGAFLEMHVEQGPVLETEGFPLGLVTGILGIKWLEVTLHGQADHAGPSPMSTRADALMSAASAISKIRERVINYGDPVVATVGRISASPGTINIIPGEVKFTLDIRHFTEEGLTSLEEEVSEVLTSVCRQEGTSFKVKQLWSNPPTRFNQKVIDIIEEALQEANVPVYKITSGAGHDAKYISEIVPTAMIFVKSVGGKSHSPEELSTFDDIEQGTQVLLESVVRLTKL